MSGQVKDVPCGIQCLKHICNSCCAHHINWKPWHQAGILVITFLAYTCYHLTRKPISVVKNVLSYNCSGISPPSYVPANDSIHWCDWVPFNTDDAPALLGLLDSSFLFAYAAAMFLSGFIAERVNLRYFLSLGMIASGISCYLFGIARPYNIHSLWYFILIQAIGGVFQTTGWPGVVTVMGNWFGKSKRGFIFGVWNSHTSLGNILGSLIAAKYVEYDWGLSFMVPGAIMGLVGFVVFLFLVPNPTDVGCSPPNSRVYRKIEASNSSDDDIYVDVGDGPHTTSEDRVIYRCVYREQVAADDPNDNFRSESSPMLSGHRRIYSAPQDSAIGFVGAVKIPGVIEYSLSLFFAKLVSYTFLYWLPLYIAASTTYGTTLSAYLSTLFDVGGIVGAIAAGVLSDYSGMSAFTCVIMFGLTFPTLFIYDYVRNASVSVNVILLLLAGLLVNGPYALITTAVSTELGTHPSLGDNSKALATVTAIIDGTGSVGAAVGPLLAGLVSRWAGWHSVFYMLMASDLLALLVLSRLVYRELKLYAQRRRVL